MDPDEGTVTGRVSIGRVQPQTIVPVGKELWVITGRRRRAARQPGVISPLS